MRQSTEPTIWCLPWLLGSASLVFELLVGWLACGEMISLSERLWMRVIKMPICKSSFLFLDEFFTLHFASFSWSRAGFSAGRQHSSATVSSSMPRKEIVVPGPIRMLHALLQNWMSTCPSLAPPWYEVVYVVCHVLGVLPSHYPL